MDENSGKPLQGKLKKRKYISEPMNISRKKHFILENPTFLFTFLMDTLDIFLDLISQSFYFYHFYFSIVS